MEGESVSKMSVSSTATDRVAGLAAQEHLLGPGHQDRRVLHVVRHTIVPAHTRDDTAQSDSVHTIRTK